MCNIPIHTQPDMHSGAQPEVRCCASKQYVAPTPGLTDSSNSVVARMLPCEHGANEPFTSNVLRLIRSIREPEARFDVASEPSLLRSFCAQQGVKIFISHKTAKIEKPGVSPVRSEKEIGRT